MVGGQQGSLAEMGGGACLSVEGSSGRGGGGGGGRGGRGGRGEVYMAGKCVEDGPCQHPGTPERLIPSTVSG